MGGDGTAVVAILRGQARDPRPDRPGRSGLARPSGRVRGPDARSHRGLPMWGPDKSVWEPFRQAATHFTDLLFIVAAGDDGRDIDEEPVWPAAFGLPNVLVVSPIAMPLLHHSGRANWGRHTVGAHASVLARSSEDYGPGQLPDGCHADRRHTAGCWYSSGRRQRRTGQDRVVGAGRQAVARPLRAIHRTLRPTWFRPAQEVGRSRNLHVGPSLAKPPKLQLPLADRPPTPSLVSCFPRNPGPYTLAAGVLHSGVHLKICGLAACPPWAVCLPHI